VHAVGTVGLRGGLLLDLRRNFILREAISSKAVDVIAAG